MLRVVRAEVSAGGRPLLGAGEAILSFVNSVCGCVVVVFWLGFSVVPEKVG